jgi:Na+:H+ antiporter, NhaA family
LPDEPFTDSHHASQTGAPARAVRVWFSPLRRFLATEAASGVVLLGTALVAILWANSRWGGLYEALWRLRVGPRLGALDLHRDLHFWINDAAMVVFFFVVGLEIKRELSGGELSDARRAAVPAFAALGGMIAPAAIFLVLNAGRPSAVGWATPMATDIAFAVGVFALLGNRVPPPLRILLLAIAVIDDLGAILVIAIFYSSGLRWLGIGIAAAGILLVVGLRRLGVRSPWAFVVPAAISWIGAYHGGVHPTLVGVAVGLLTPARPLKAGDLAPVVRIEQTLHSWVAYGIMPLFALANAGVPLGEVVLAGHGWYVLAGVVLGLVVGKPLGILAVTTLAVRAGFAALPVGIRRRDVLVVGLVAGIGFTMALFIADLGFSGSPLVEVARLGILCASAVAALLGVAGGWILLRPTPVRPDRLVAQSVGGQASEEEGYPARDLVSGGARGTLLSSSSRMEVMSDMGAFGERVLGEIGRARRRVDVESFIVRADHLGGELARALMAAAARGVRCRLLYDPLGCRTTPRSYFAALAERGVAVRRFGWVGALLFGRLLNRPAARNHARVIVVDDAGYTGGHAWGDEWWPAARGGEDWHDVCCGVQGAIVEDFAKLCELHWSESNATHPIGDYLGEPRDGLRLVSDAPVKESVILGRYLDAIAAARRRVWLANAYFFPPPSLRDALVKARGRGVDVKIIVPGISDVPIIQLAAEAHYRRWMAAGLEVWEYQRVVMHAKYALVDDDWCLIGTFNANVASVAFAIEVALVSQRPADATAVAAQLERDLAVSRPVDAARLGAISLGRRILGRIAALLMRLANVLFARRPI